MKNLPANPTKPALPRRQFLADLGLGFTGLSLGAMLARDGVSARAATIANADAPTPSTPPTGQPQFAPKAKSVIWVFLSGGYSHVETFDPKPALTAHAGKTFDKTPFENPLKSRKQHARFRSVPAQEVNVRDVYPTIYPMQVGFAKHGRCGVELTDWWPNLAGCVDDLAFVRNMWTTDNDHFAENQIHTGRHRLDEQQPSLGAWVHYGLGTMNENLPKFVVLGGPTNSTTRWSIDSLYLGPGVKAMPGALEKALVEAFGSVAKFKEDFSAAGAGQFGSGWAWLVKDADGALKVTKTENGVNPLCFGQTALLGCDVWEHSYYIDFRNKRPAYLTNFLDNLVNWEAVAARM